MNLGDLKLSGWHLTVLLLCLVTLTTWGMLWAQWTRQSAANERIDILVTQGKALEIAAAIGAAARNSMAISVFKLQDDMRDTVKTMREMHTVLQDISKDFIIIRRRLENGRPPGKSVPKSTDR